MVSQNMHTCGKSQNQNKKKMEKMFYELMKQKIKFY